MFGFLINSGDISDVNIAAGFYQHLELLLYNVNVLFLFTAYYYFSRQGMIWNTTTTKLIFTKLVPQAL